MKTLLNEEELNAREILIKYASKGQTISVSKLIDESKLNFSMDSPYERSYLIGRILGKIVLYEHENNRPMLSSIVVDENNKRGDGFYKMAEELGYGTWQTLKRNFFDIEEMNKTYSYWKNNKL